jgi:hypothetical protein
LYLNGDVETAASLSKTLGWVLLAFSALELIIPVAEIAGDQFGEWWRGRKSEVDP